MTTQERQIPSLPNILPIPTLERIPSPPVIVESYKNPPPTPMIASPSVGKPPTTWSRITKATRNFTDKVVNFQNKNPMLTMVVIAIIVAILAPQLLPILL